MTNPVDLPRWYKFRAFGVLRPGYLRVEFIAPPQRPGFVTMHDIVLDELSVNDVPMAARVPNAEFWIRLNQEQEPTAVQLEMPTEVEDYKQ